MGTLGRTLRDHFLQCSLHDAPYLEMKPGNPRPAHLIDEGSLIQAEVRAAAFGPPITKQPIQACAE